MDSHRRRLKLRFWLALIILVIALVVLVLSSLPETRIQQVVPLPPVVLPTPTPVSLLFTWKGI